MWKQLLKVKTSEKDGDETGAEWFVHFVLYQDEEDGVTVYDLYTDNGCGNGARICRFENLKVARSLTLRLGTFVEWDKPLQ